VTSRPEIQDAHVTCYQLPRFPRFSPLTFLAKRGRGCDGQVGESVEKRTDKHTDRRTDGRTLASGDASSAGAAGGHFLCRRCLSRWLSRRHCSSLERVNGKRKKSTSTDTQNDRQTLVSSDASSAGAAGGVTFSGDVSDS
jgi:hypothetical protein